MKYRFKIENKDANKRKQMSEKIIKQYPDKIPIICEKDPRSKLKDIEKTKYLMPKDLTVSQFHLIIRNKIELNQEESLFLLVDGKISLVGETRLGDIYEKYANKEDGFLYIVYAEQLYKGGL